MPRTKKLSKEAEKTLAILKAKAAARKRRPPPAKAPVRPKKPKQEAPKETIRKASYGKQDLEHFKSIIIAKKREILDELETLRDTMIDSTTGEYVSENPTYSTHMEQGTDSMEREKTFMFASREGKFLNHLEDALQRIVKGDYGRCTDCGKLIEKERLEAVPHAQQCLQCKLRRSK
ncbi:MAG: TraR/DksA C4-type zinc finger protein [Bacteroidota bacterium]|jgi:RNA polymerase-binding protein DksA